MKFFTKRFNCIRRHVQDMRTKSVSRIDNRKLSRLVIEHNKVHHDLILINDFFKFYVGINLIAFMAMGTPVMFAVLLELDTRLKWAFFVAIFFLYLTIIYVPYTMAKSVTNEINRTKRCFENIAFHKSVNRTIKQKIELISSLSGKAGFTCFDWFLLEPFTGLRVRKRFGLTIKPLSSNRSFLKVSFEFVFILLLFVQTYYYIYSSAMLL